MEKIPFNFDWIRRIDDELSPFSTNPDDEVKVDLPDDFVINMTRDKNIPVGASVGFFPGGKATYIKKFLAPVEWHNRTVILNIDGAYMNAEVSLNSEKLALHPYGYTPFLVDLTRNLKCGRENILSVITQVRHPSSRWYSGGGLYRQVSLWIGNPCNIEPWDIFVTTPEVNNDTALVHISVKIANTLSKKRDAVITALLSRADGIEVAKTSTSITLKAKSKTPAELDIAVTSPNLWDTEHPYLYDLSIELSVNGEVADYTAKKLGIRKIEIGSKNGMRVNGKSVKLRGGCIHHDNALLGARAFPRAEERKIQILKDAGYNAIRTAHNPPSEALLDACDRLGMYVLDESFDCWRMGKNSLDYHLYFEDWWQRDTAAMVLRDRNHPSVYCWSVGNEIPESGGVSNGEYWLQAQVGLVHTLDPTRPVTCGGMFLPVLDNDRKKPLLEPDDDNLGPVGPSFDMEKQDIDKKEILRRIDSLVHIVDILSLNYRFPEYKEDGVKFPDRAIQGTESQSFYAWENWDTVKANNHVIGDFTWTAYDNLGEAGAGRVIWNRDELSTWLCGDYPWLSCYQGDMDLDGRRRPQSYYRKILWGLDKGIHVFTHHPSRTGTPFYGMGWHWADVKQNWTFGKEYLGKPVKVEAYADCDEVEFILNGKSIAKVVPGKLKARCVVPYEPGVLEAVAIKGGVPVARDSIVTTGAPAGITLEADRPVIAADGEDLCYVTARIVDADGKTVVTSDIELAVSMTGNSRLAGLGSANPCTPENYGTGRRFVFDGYALICIRADREAGDIHLTVTADGFPAAELDLRCVSIL